MAVILREKAYRAIKDRIVSGQYRPGQPLNEKEIIQELQISRTPFREAINALGEICRETEYSLEPLPEGEFTLTLDMVRGEGDLYVFDYGLIWR